MSGSTPDLEFALAIAERRKREARKNEKENGSEIQEEGCQESGQKRRQERAQRAGAKDRAQCIAQGAR